MTDFGGFTPASRKLVRLAGGRTAFAKGATTDLTEVWLRTEHHVYTHLQGSFMPELLGWDESGLRPILLLEDLSSARWPPPWQPGDEELVLAALDQLHLAPAPSGLPSAAEELGDNWPEVIRDPQSLLGLGLVTPRWLERYLSTLADAGARASLAGDSIVHLDVRSDNLCFRDGRVLLVDWNWASLGNPALDAQFWLPSLVLEGGTPPVELEPEYGAWVSGFMAARAGLAPIPDAPGVRPIQLAQLKVVLPWTCRLLGIEPPDGITSPPGRV